MSKMEHPSRHTETYIKQCRYLYSIPQGKTMSRGEGVIWPPFCKSDILEKVERVWPIAQWSNVIWSIVVPAC